MDVSAPQRPPLAGLGVPVRRIAPLGGLRLRFAAWLHRDRLTRCLAEGVSPVASRQLAARAAQLGAARTRRRLARSLEQAAAEVERPPATFGSRVPVAGRPVAATRPLILDLASRLRSPGPAHARGVALVLLLLTDVSSPLYANAPAGVLEAVLRTAGAALDPSLG